MSDFTLDLDPDGVAVIAWDQPGTAMNVMTRDGLAAFEALFEQVLADPAVKGIVLTSAKADFAGGMDLNVLGGLRAEAGARPAQALFDFTMTGHHILRRIERNTLDPRTNRGGKPVVWACPGTSAGIGTEIGLACHRRIAADTPRARIGLPEIKVGLFPGGGGTTRFVRMVGLMAAAPVLLEGKMMPPAQAKSLGLIDEVVPPEDLIARAKEWALLATDQDLVKPWDARGFKFPGGAPYSPAGFMTFVGANAMVLGRTQGVYPAAQAMLSAIYEGAQVDFDTALRIEARWFTSVLMDPRSEAMVRSLFLNKTALEKGAARPALPEAKVRRLGVLGAGMMGAGIAHVAAEAGIEVVLIDRDQAAAERGKAHSESLLDKAIKRRKTTEADKARVLSHITPSADYAALRGCDLVVEAVFEDPALKAEVTARAEAMLGEEAIFATNTSTLPIGDLAQASRDAARFIGIHFFSPVDRMMLVEIIRGRQTGDAAVAKALDFVRQIRKTPIVVNDARFFYANRCIIPYINEGVMMVGEGIAPALIENAARQMGMPLGPLQLTDETSIDLAVRIARATRAAMGDAYPAATAQADAVLLALFEAGRLGRKAGAGFYAYDEGGKRQGLWPGLAAQWPGAAAQPGVAEVRHRLALIQVLEAVRALEEGVLTDIREGDVGAILGWGFMPWSGGPFGWIDIEGPDRVVALCDRLAETHGPRFAAPELLRRMAAEGRRFYHGARAAA
ncbi:3-hydroxyacyl-CoA dehydrogenase [Halovulum dunhuangense]|uniref:3-hydroxyacyl-CoA dehydrogenase n=1 Tax=Halovulum dunhuangense TaxID=1505036 RepID=A0A849L4K9_9RHOB|nr:3-hydroxyacyl-CoA dehydrogenase NAD-binding domain-containing protein [Halovulum dunhuangense]NNU81193.1 3-hydroxyacyl-CoA dehydrogenase [Halovulum dunhuangense]